MWPTKHGFLRYNEVRPCRYFPLLSYVFSVTNPKPVDAEGAFVLEENVRRKLLRDVVLPQIPDKAGALARDVDELLSVFAAPPRGGAAVKARRAPASGADTDHPRKRAKLSEPLWANDWRQELKGIFEKALRLRVELDKRGGEYVFSFPVPGSGWVTDDEQSQVQIGLFPSVEGRFQTVRGGPWGEWEQLTDAEVASVTMDDDDTGTCSAVLFELVR